MRMGTRMVAPHIITGIAYALIWILLLGMLLEVGLLLLLLRVEIRIISIVRGALLFRFNCRATIHANFIERTRFVNHILLPNRGEGVLFGFLLRLSTR